jgi:polysaccharide deacetylase 2 family uncharacterized protein YibQ
VLRSFAIIRGQRSRTHQIAIFIGILVVCLAGCKFPREKRLRAEEIHRITREFVIAANSAVPRGSEVRSQIGAFEKVANSADGVEIHIPVKSDGKERPAPVAQLLQALGKVATLRGLTQDPEAGDADAIFLTYRHAGVVTHTIHLHFVEPDDSSERNPGDAGQNSAQARLAIILDDLGNDRTAADAIFALPYPLTISILPNHTHSTDIAEEAHRRGYEVMLHLPMQALGNERPEAQELHAGMRAGDIAALVNNFLKEVPGVAGVNNHQGSQSTADEKLMAELMPVLQQHKLFYIDSRTSAATVAYDTAQRFGVRAGFRNVPFLDDVEAVPAVRKQIELAIRGAAKKREAIAIGHAHRSTLQALRETLPDARNQGVKLVFASELVR